MDGQMVEGTGQMDGFVDEWTNERLGQMDG